MADFKRAHKSGVSNSLSSQVIPYIPVVPLVMLMQRKVDICGLQEVRWRSASARVVEGKDSRYKMFRVGNDKDIQKIQTCNEF